MKLKEYQLSDGMSCTGVVLWNQGINESMEKAARMGRNEKRGGICSGKLQEREDHYTPVTKFMFHIWDFITMRKKEEKIFRGSLQRSRWWWKWWLCFAGFFCS